MQSLINGKFYVRKDSSLEWTKVSSIHSLLRSYAQHDDDPHHRGAHVSIPELSFSIYSKYDHFTGSDHKNVNRNMPISRGYRGATLCLSQRGRLRRRRAGGRSRTSHHRRSPSTGRSSRCRDEAANYAIQSVERATRNYRESHEHSARHRRNYWKGHRKHHPVPRTSTS